MKTQVFTYNNHDINFGITALGDVLVHPAQMAAAVGKPYTAFHSMECVKSYMEALGKMLNPPPFSATPDNVPVCYGLALPYQDDKTALYYHHLLALRYAYYLDRTFGSWMRQIIDAIILGSHITVRSAESPDQNSVQAIKALDLKFSIY